ncbi:phosphatidylserine decarboxylase 1 [Ascosphaera pollenicola]|nr:phosphatidylserine decarboxylase 1 [Ascosphaera pollenicola]
MSLSNAEDSQQSSPTEEINVNIVSPSAGVPDSYLVTNIKLTTTVLDLKQRLKDELDGHPSPADQRLIYRGRPLFNDTETLKAIFHSDLHGPTKTPSIHLVLPPRTPGIPAPSSIPQQQEAGSFDFSNIPSSQPHAPHYAPSTTYGTVPYQNDPPYVPEMAPAMPRISAETERRAMAESLFLPIRPEGQAILGSSAERSTPEWRQRVEIADTLFSYERQHRAGDTVPLENLLQLQRDLCRLRSGHVNDASPDSDEFVDFLLVRLQAMIRNASESSSQTHAAADDDGLAQSTSINSSDVSQQHSSCSMQTSVYLLTGPDGYQALLMPPQGPSLSNTTNFDMRYPLYRTTESPRVNPMLQTDPFLPAMGANNNPLQYRPRHLNFPQFPSNQRIRQHGPRTNGQRRPQHIQVAYINVTSWLRRIWVFIRLYFLAYLISEDHTLLRYGLVTLALLAAIASGTDYPQMVYNAAIGPIHRHIENLIPLEGDFLGQAGREEGPAAAPAGDAAETGRQQQPGGVANTTGSRLRSWERSIALFMATLIPGIGERHIAARLAAREAAEARRRVEATTREQERSQQEQQERAATEPEMIPVGETASGQATESGTTTGHQRTGDTEHSTLRPRGTAETTSA